MDTKETQFLQLIGENKGILYKICKIYEDDPDDRDDLLQEMVLQLWRAFDTFRGDSKFSSWMYRVALNTAIVFFKRQKRRPDDQPLPAQFDHADDLPDAEEHQEKLAVFYKAVQKLGKVEKALIYLYMEDQPYDEIAAHLGITQLNVRVRLNRVKNKLKEIIKEMNYEY
ncbi:RNA polymerase sigma factor [Mucilaginibacter ginsenosidivorans]|uniref:Sigma-70 family RNA polymerase sigma factor n=1 Tax=Mucilaginibacter ginsenosidivorans TaxID=398053 RepID=A0A5B8UV63_9SPHI|nr:sigma-70 family RNA polymerase sigma factor [Mucilaginibacter ginsenosidivorans]QEC62812.1 sigma-70 family RNA polymerase sigma factor [Mucilaginibacter ginsenosidivorans]